jgi:formylglycine-generating enzyme required for sulfatase activity
MTQPNVLFIMTDQQRFDAMGAMGNPKPVRPVRQRMPVLFAALAFLIVGGVMGGCQTRQQSTGPNPGDERNFGGIPFVWVPPGEFLMGTTQDEEERVADERPHPVTLTRGFWMGKYEVTQEEWQRVMGNRPAHFTGDDRLPVENVSWKDCQAFLQKLNGQDPSGTFRLPTEAEWEYACRAGTNSPYTFGSNISTDQANFDGRTTHGSRIRGVYRERTVPVGNFGPNEWGLHDMSGNVWEWCADAYQPYPDGEAIDPITPATGNRLVMRGGAWTSQSLQCRSAKRGYGKPTYRKYDVGFRIVRNP